MPFPAWASSDRPAGSTRRSGRSPARRACAGTATNALATSSTQCFSAFLSTTTVGFWISDRGGREHQLVRLAGGLRQQDLVLVADRHVAVARLEVLQRVVGALVHDGDVLEDALEQLLGVAGVVRRVAGDLAPHRRRRRRRRCSTWRRRSATGRASGSAGRAASGRSSSAMCFGLPGRTSNATTVVATMPPSVSSVQSCVIRPAFWTISTSGASDSATMSAGKPLATFCACVVLAPNEVWKMTDWPSWSVLPLVLEGRDQLAVRVVHGAVRGQRDDGRLRGRAVALPLRRRSRSCLKRQRCSSCTPRARRGRGRRRRGVDLFRDRMDIRTPFDRPADAGGLWCSASGGPVNRKKKISSVGSGRCRTALPTRRGRGSPGAPVDRDAYSMYRPKPGGVKGIRPWPKVHPRERHTFATRRWSWSVPAVQLARRVEEPSGGTRVGVPVVGDPPPFAVDVVAAVAVALGGDPLEVGEQPRLELRLGEAVRPARRPSASGTRRSRRPSTRRPRGASR